MSIAILIIALIFCVFAIDSYVRGKSVVVQPFWVFSYFFVLSYPIRYIIVALGFPIQAPVTPNNKMLLCALILSMLFWMMVCGAYFFFVKRYQNDVQPLCQNAKLGDNQWLTKVLIFILIGISSIYYFNLLEYTGGCLVNAYNGNEQNLERIGRGAKFLLGQVYIFAAILYIFFLKDKSKNTTIIVFFTIIMISMLEMVLLATRPPPYIIFYCLLLYAYIKNQKSIKWMLILASYLVIMSFAAPIGQVLRYSNLSFSLINFDFAIISLGSTFEGVEHLARFLERVKVQELLWGVDQGVSYAFNSILALIPRALWHAKPLIYGSVEQQNYLWPTEYDSIKLPVGIVVDALYAFGILGFVIYAFIAGRFLLWIEHVFKYGFHQGNRYMLSIAAFIYVHMFNFIRSGTAILQGVVMLSAFLLLARVLDCLSRYQTIKKFTQ